MVFRNLQSIRGLACIIIVLTHIAGAEADRFAQAWLSPLRLFGYCGLNLFFVLSGFIITWVYYEKLGNRRSAGGFLQKRFVRIFPVYWACLLIAVAGKLLIEGVVLYHPSYPGRTREIVRIMCLLPHKNVNLYLPQAWSLVYEVFCYLAFCCFFFLPRRAFVPLLVAWFLATLAGGILLDSSVPHLLMFVTQPMVLDFLLGCAIAVLARRGYCRGGWVWTAVGLSGYAIGATLNALKVTDGMGNYWHRFYLAGIPSAFLVYGLTALERTSGRTLPRWLESVGDASYSIYLTHLTVVSSAKLEVFRAGGTWGAHLLWLVGFLAASLIVGYMAFFAVERPVLAWLRRRSSRAVHKALSPAAPVRRAA
jgi:peptidoglycan/LPS O-acetylase OafA/YrhL